MGIEAEARAERAGIIPCLEWVERQNFALGHQRHGLHEGLALRIEELDRLREVTALRAALGIESHRDGGLLFRGGLHGAREAKGKPQSGNRSRKEAELGEHSGSVAVPIGFATAPGLR